MHTNAKKTMPPISQVWPWVGAGIVAGHPVSAKGSLKMANSLHLWLFLVVIRISVTERPFSSLFASSRRRSLMSPPTLITELSDENPAMAGAALRF
jgi:hypothetical protein